MNGSRRPSKARRRARNGWRRVFIVLAVGSMVALGGFATGELVIAQRQKATDTAHNATASNSDEIYTGSILYMPDQGRTCHQLLFDNRSGRFTDNGYVDCESAAYQGTDDVPKQWSAARLRVISDGFFPH
jgi:hypothetical protein